ncbi:hypothetical protein PSTG_11876 [Puccinia striiformis f. sp. tritici PST-78]|uniref:Uncharacterized protein n=1 Tax=Puccinia striiformis f. sp. tritici PST-78 TaxID=1165861 RepID=A0A0L0V6Z8_9BASI|nr:hypothetical protein PSTG_11876 [Puccinia striiformis f. sp. tritici PST-78]
MLLSSSESPLTWGEVVDFNLLVQRANLYADAWASLPRDMTIDMRRRVSLGQLAMVLAVRHAQAWDRVDGAISKKVPPVGECDAKLNASPSLRMRCFCTANFCGGESAKREARASGGRTWVGFSESPITGRKWKGKFGIGEAGRSIGIGTTGGD